MLRNEHINALGYKVAFADEGVVRPLLETVGLEPLPQVDGTDYIAATTAAGGIAACAGWTTLEQGPVVLHSLAVAPPSRGSGVGASLLATVMAYAMDRGGVPSIYLTTRRARRFFEGFGFHVLDEEDIPAHVGDHPTFQSREQGRVPMVRAYQNVPRGLDRSAFQIVENQAEDAVMPPGSLIFMHQRGAMLEAHYRGGPVSHGHILGKLDGNQLSYFWHAFSKEEALMQGQGAMTISSLDDGRRELTELGADGTIELVMREI